MDTDSLRQRGRLGPVPEPAPDPLRLAIAADPDDDAPRLVYADWLEERGDPRAGFIRVQCELARLGDDADLRPDLKRREWELYQAHRDRWLREDLPGHVTDHKHAGNHRFRRGFVESVFLLPSEVRAHAPTLFRNTPLRGLQTFYSTHGIDNQLGPVLAAWACPPLAELEVYCDSGDHRPLRELGGFPCLSRLESLTIRSYDEAIDWATTPDDTPLAAEDVRALARSPHLAGLTTLRLWRDTLGPAVREVLDSPTLARLDRLELHGALGPEGVRAVVASPGAARLTALDLSGVCSEAWAGTDGVRALVASPHLGRLRRLGLAVNHLDDRAGGVLAGWSGLEGVVALDLTYNRIGDDGLRALAGSPHAWRLESLVLKGNSPITDAGVRALAESPHLARLKRLNLDQSEYHGGHPIGDAGVAALASSPHLTGLRVLDLGASFELSDRAARMLARSRTLENLCRLDCGMASPAAVARLEARWGDRVAVRPRPER